MPSAGEPKGLEPPPKMTDEERAQAPALREAYEASRVAYYEQRTGEPLGEWKKKGRPR